MWDGSYNHPMSRGQSSGDSRNGYSLLTKRRGEVKEMGEEAAIRALWMKGIQLLERSKGLWGSGHFCWGGGLDRRH